MNCNHISNYFGHVCCYWVHPETKQLKHFLSKTNLELFSAADILAKVLGKETNYTPSHIGFIYGDNIFTLNQPSRSDTWASIATEIASSPGEGNIQIVPLSVSPVFETTDTVYAHNKVTFFAQSNPAAPMAFTPQPGVYSGPMWSGARICHALLLSKINDTTYLPFARISLMQNNQYPQKPNNWEISLFWSIVFS